MRMSVLKCTSSGRLALAVPNSPGLNFATLEFYEHCEAEEYCGAL